MLTGDESWHVRCQGYWNVYEERSVIIVMTHSQYIINTHTYTHAHTCTHTHTHTHAHTHMCTHTHTRAHTHTHARVHAHTRTHTHTHTQSNAVVFKVYLGLQYLIPYAYKLSRDVMFRLLNVTSYAHWDSLEDDHCLVSGLNKIFNSFSIIYCKVSWGNFDTSNIDSLTQCLLKHVWYS